MDPDFTLLEIRQLADDLIWSEGQSCRMAELFLALDGWLTIGGFPPKDWDFRDSN